MKPAPTPPSWAIRLLRWFCHPDLADEIQGDLTEVFSQKVQSGRSRMASVLFVFGVLSFFRPFAWKSRDRPPMASSMIRSYVKIAWRGMIRHRLFTCINIAGLALSMSVGLVLISLIDELIKFDQFHEKKDRIHRVISTVYDPLRPTDDKATAPLPLAEKLGEMAGIESVVRIQRSVFDEVGNGTISIPAEGYFADPSFLSVFSLQLIRGNAGHALAEPFSIVLTRSRALMLFKTDEVLGQRVELKSLGSFMVTGVLEDPPRHSHLQFDLVCSFVTVPILERQKKLPATSERWDRTYLNYLYFLLEPGYPIKTVGEHLQRLSNTAYSDPTAYHIDFNTQALLDIVPGVDLSTQIGPKMMYLPLIIFSALAIVIALSACFNSTNFAIARSLRRAREVGLRKINGARRQEIAAQFMSEAVFVSMISMVVALGIFYMIKPHFLQNAPMLSKLIELQFSGRMFLYSLGFALLVGICAGLMPAVLVSRVTILDALKQLKGMRLVGHSGIRNGLLVFQITLSLFLATAIVITYRQYDFAVHRYLGFEKENTVVVPLQGVNHERVAAAMQTIPEITSTSFSSLLPGVDGTQSRLVVMNEGVDSVYTFTMSANRDFIRDLRFALLAGSNFPDSLSGIREQFALINRQFLALLHLQFPTEAIGKVIRVDGQDLEIIGVMEDFNYAELEEPIKPFFVRYAPKEFAFAVLRIQSGNVPASLAAIGHAWRRVADDVAFNPRFYDDEIQETYSFYVRLMRVFGYVAILAMAIAAMGLLGMAIYTAETRMKEIGIRKVMGATTPQIVMLLSKSFVFLLIGSATIALPAAYLLFDKVVLALGAYRIAIGPLELCAGLILMLLTGGLTIASQTYRAAQANPVETLRSQ